MMVHEPIRQTCFAGWLLIVALLFHNFGQHYDVAGFLPYNGPLNPTRES